MSYTNRDDRYTDGSRNTINQAPFTTAEFYKKMKHQLYEGFEGPDSIKDGNGEVVLALCKLCGLGESQLEDECDPLGTVHRLIIQANGCYPLESESAVHSRSLRQALKILEGMRDDIPQSAPNEI